MFIEATISAVVFPLANCSPTWRLRDSRLMQVVSRSPEAGQPGEVSAPAAEDDAEAVISGQAAGDDHRPRVRSTPSPSRHAGRDRDHVLQRPAELAADHVGVGVDAKHRAARTAAASECATWASGIASTAAAARPCSTSRAMLGPASSPAGMPGQLGAWMICVIRCWLPCSRPLAEAQHRHPRAEQRRDRAQRLAKAVRRHADDEARRKPRTASSSEAVARSAGCSADPVR